MATATTPSPPIEELHKLFTSVEAQFPSSTLGTEGWYLVVLSALTSSRKCHLSTELYKYLITLPQYSTSEARQKLMRRLREALVKLVSIIGVALPLETVFQLDKVTAPADRDYSFSRQDWKNDEAHHERGVTWLRNLYAENLDPIFKTFESHKDFGWISTEITYGLYLSDHSILDGVETELCMLSGLFCLGTPREFSWHLRGSRRIGISSNDCELVQQCIESVAGFVGLDVGLMPRVKDIEHEVQPLRADEASG